MKSALLALIHIFFSFCCNRRRFFFLFIIFFVCVLKNTYHYLESTAGQLRLSAPISSARLVFRILASRNLPSPSFATSHVTAPRGYPHLWSKKIKINNVFRGNAPLPSTDNIAPNHNNTRIFEDYEKKINEFNERSVAVHLHDVKMG